MWRLGAGHIPPLTLVSGVADGGWKPPRLSAHASGWRGKKKRIFLDKIHVLLEGFFI
jgi:hypothetical protein